MAHQIVKPEILVAAAVAMLEEELVIPNLFRKEGVDRFKGAKDDTINFKVEGVLPYREYAWRNNRASSIVFDEYAERTYSISFGGNYYSAVKLTDEQNDFDLESWAKLLRPQVKAVARGLQRKAITTLTGQNYAVTIGRAEENLRGAIIEARRVLDALHAPSGDRYMLLGSNFESAILNSTNLTLAQNVGDNVAEGILRTAIIGQLFGFTFVVDPTIPPNDAYAFSGSGFVFASGAPSVPQSVPFGATTSFEGLALRWMRDYDSAYLQDRSIVNCYAGFRTVEDVLVGWDEANKTEVVSTDEHFVRGIRLTLQGYSDYPQSGSELATITGVSHLDVWYPSTRGQEIASGATAGTPGSFTPAGSTAPQNLATLRARAVVASPATAWTTGQRVVLGDTTTAHWDSNSWEAGNAA